MRGLAIIIRPGGVMERVVDAPVNDLQWLHQELGGYIEIAYTTAPGGRERIVVWDNEDGQRLELPPNCTRASDGWLLLGNLVVTGCTAGGDNRGLTPIEEEGVILVQGPGARYPTLNLWSPKWGLQP